MSKHRPNEDRALVDCTNAEWHKELHSHLYQGAEVDLINFDYELHGESCELIAQAFTMEFQMDRIPEAKSAHFRRKLADWCRATDAA